MSQTILLIGSTGQLGRQLQQTLKYCGNIITPPRSQLDLTQPETIRLVIRQTQPQTIINAAAYTAVELAESEIDLATTINAIAPGILAQEAQKIGASLIHISTDYVFDGYQSYPYQETNSPNPLNSYGKTKLAGERAIQNYCENYLILRSAWLYGIHGSNFVKTMLELGAKREEIRVVADQIGSPTWTFDLAEAIGRLLQYTCNYGIYHYTNSGVASWYDFAVAIFEQAQQLGFPLKVQRVIPITTFEYPTFAQRPAYSVLSCAKIAATVKMIPPHWQKSLGKMLTAYAQNYESADPLWR
jgi:dTDP-4-dehydrorhamnose reductase